MSRRTYRPHRTLNERIGALVLWPIKFVVKTIVVAGLILIYPIVTAWLFKAAFFSGELKGVPVKTRLKRVFGWPLLLLAVNGFASLGGMNVEIPGLSRVGEWLDKSPTKPRS